jgi:hypothetical protein
MSRPPDGPALCPSAPGTPGAVLIGVVGEDGRVANLGTPLPVDAGFLDVARALAFEARSPSLAISASHLLNLVR